MQKKLLHSYIVTCYHGDKRAVIRKTLEFAAYKLEWSIITSSKGRKILITALSESSLVNNQPNQSTAFAPPPP